MAGKATKPSFAEHLKEAPLARDTSPKLVITGEVRRSADDERFVFSSPESGTVELPVDAVVEYEPVDDGLTRITLDVSRGRRRPARAGADGKGAVPFVLATPHRAPVEVLRNQAVNEEGSAAIMDVDTRFVVDTGWLDPFYL